MNDLESVENASAGELEVIQPGALAAMTGAEIDVQIATAKRYPRSMTKFRQIATSLATVNEDVALSCFYTLKRRDAASGENRLITGPSIRLAEICAIAWGNIRFGARLIDDDGKQLTAQGIAHDLERNVAVSIDVRRRVTNKSGKRYTDDMVIVTGMAACAIARRNAIFNVIPLSLVKEIEAECKRVSTGDAKTFETKRQAGIANLKKIGLDEERILAAIGKSCVEDIDGEALAVLRGAWTSIQSGEHTIEDLFPASGSKQPGGESSANGSRLEEIKRAMQSSGSKNLSGASDRGVNGEDIRGPKTEPPKDADATAAAKPDEDHLAAQDFLSDLEEELAKAESVADTQAIGTKLVKARTWIGESAYEAFVAKIQAKNQQIEEAAKAARAATPARSKAKPMF